MGADRIEMIGIVPEELINLALRQQACLRLDVNMI
jgi:hypothetical protein